MYRNIYILSLSLLTLYLDPLDPLTLFCTNRLLESSRLFPTRIPTYFPLPLYNPIPR